MAPIKLSKLSFKMTERLYAVNDYPVPAVQIFVDGEDLRMQIIEHMRSIDPDKDSVDDDYYVEVEPVDLYKELNGRGLVQTDYADIFDCECGCMGCSPLLIKVTKEDDLVIWHDFNDGHKKYAFPSIIFDRKQYDTAMRKLKRMSIKAEEILDELYENYMEEEYKEYGEIED